MFEGESLREYPQYLFSSDRIDSGGLGVVLLASFVKGGFELLDFGCVAVVNLPRRPMQDSRAHLAAA